MKGSVKEDMNEKVQGVIDRDKSASAVRIF